MALDKKLISEIITLNVSAVQTSPWGINDKVFEVDGNKTQLSLTVKTRLQYLAVRMTDHAGVTWLSCTDHVADRTLIM